MVCAAAGFGGGMGRRDLCGLLTGGIMTIGFAGGKIHDNRDSMRGYVRAATGEYWSWWESRAPLHCRELRDQYNGTTEYLRMCKRVAVKLEDLIMSERLR